MCILHLEPISKRASRLNGPAWLAARSRKAQAGAVPGERQENYVSRHAPGAPCDALPARRRERGGRGRTTSPGVPRARPVTHFPAARRRRSEAVAQAAASDRWPADGAGAGRRRPASERAGGLAPPPPRPPCPVTFRARATGAGPGGGGGAMFVQEEKIFAGKVLRLHICASDGAEWLEEATEDTSVEQLKERCLKHVRPAPPQASVPPSPSAGLGTAPPAPFLSHPPSRPPAPPRRSSPSRAPG